MTFRNTVFLSGLALCWTTVAASAEVLSLSPEDLPRILSEGNQAVRGAELQADAAELRTGHLVRSYLPTVVLEGGAESFKTGPYPMFTQPQGAAEVRLNLFRGGRDLLEDRVLGAQARAASAQSRKTKASELADARRIYWELVFQREEIRILQAALEENARHRVAADRRIQRGLATDTDRLDFQIQESQLKEEIESITHLTKQTSIRLRAALGMNGDIEFKTLDVTPHEHDEAYLSATLDRENQQDVAFLKAGLDAARSEGSQLSRWWPPSIDAYGGYYLYTLRDRDFLTQGFRDDQVVGVRVSLEFEVFGAVNSARSANLRAEGLENEAIQGARDTEARLRVSQEDMKHEHELTHEAETRIGQGEAYLARTLGEYDRGLKNSPDVLSASQRLLGFRRRSAEIRKNYQLAKVELLSILGK